MFYCLNEIIMFEVLMEYDIVAQLRNIKLQICTICVDFAGWVDPTTLDVAFGDDLILT